MTDWPVYRDELDPVFGEVVTRLSTTVGILKFGEVAGDAAPDWVPDWVFTIKPLEGYDFYAFFDPAAALSGQKLDAIEEVYALISAVRTSADDGLEAFQSGMAQVLSHWAGDAAIRCAEFVGGIVDYANSQRDSLFVLAEALVAYAAIIQEARKSLVALMAACDDGFAQVTKQGEAAGLNVAITLLTEITGAVIAVATGGAALPAFAAAVLTAGGEAGKQMAALDGVSYAAVADSYLAKARELVGETAKAINANVVPRLHQALEALPRTPPVPTGLDDAESFHPRSSEGSPSGVTAQPAGSIGQRLEG